MSEPIKEISLWEFGAQCQIGNVQHLSFSDVFTMGYTRWITPDVIARVVRSAEPNSNLPALYRNHLAHRPEWRAEFEKYLASMDDVTFDKFVERHGRSYGPDLFWIAARRYPGKRLFSVIRWFDWEMRPHFARHIVDERMSEWQTDDLRYVVHWLPDGCEKHREVCAELVRRLKEGKPVGEESKVWRETYETVWRYPELEVELHEPMLSQMSHWWAQGEIEHFCGFMLVDVPSPLYPRVRQQLIDLSR